jgi:hypothetical protein
MPYICEVDELSSRPNSHCSAPHTQLLPADIQLYDYLYYTIAHYMAHQNLCLVQEDDI